MFDLRPDLSLQLLYMIQVHLRDFNILKTKFSFTNVIYGLITLFVYIYVYDRFAFYIRSIKNYTSNC